MVKISDQTNYYELSDFQLDGDDAYDARCAEIFITLNRVLVFQCSFCNKKYGNFGYFLEHLSIEHFEQIEEQKQYETNPVESIQLDLDQVIEESNEENPLDETLHEYDELEYTEKCNVEEIDESIISDGGSHSEFPEYGEEYLKEIENVVISHKPHHRNDETQSKDQENLSSGKRSKSPLSPSSLNVKPTILIHANASQEKSKTKKESNKGFFKCDICGKTCRRSMKLHLITHSSERNHKCEYCGFAFKDRSNLKSHVRRCHTGKKNISCDICSKKFFTRTESEAHMRTHTGEKPYMCSFCGLAFQTASKMTTHAKRHTEKAPLQCSYCKKDLWSKQDMTDHLLVHTKEKPFACPICSARFPRRKSMLRHTKLHDK